MEERCTKNIQEDRQHIARPEELKFPTGLKFTHARLYILNDTNLNTAAQTSFPRNIYTKQKNNFSQNTLEPRWVHLSINCRGLCLSRWRKKYISKSR